MHSSPAPAGVSAGLVRWRAGATYAAPNNAGTPAFWIRPETGSVAADICLVVPFQPGSANAGALQTSIADGTAQGGNKRGAGAADLQIARNAASKVASGSFSFQAGQNNSTLASGSASIGSDNVNNAGNCMLLGVGMISNTGSDYGSGIGRQGTIRGIVGHHVHSAGNIAAQADCQYERTVQGVRSLNGPFGVFVAGAGAASTGVLLTCPNNSVVGFICEVIGFQAGMANIYKANWSGAMYRSGATMAFVSAPVTMAAPSTLGTGNTWTVTPTIDATNFGFYIAITSTGVFTQWTVVTHSALAT